MEGIKENIKEMRIDALFVKKSLKGSALENICGYIQALEEIIEMIEDAE